MRTRRKSCRVALRNTHRDAAHDRQPEQQHAASSCTSAASMMPSATKNGTNSPISVPMPRSNSYSASTSFVTRVMIRPTATRS